MLGLSAAKGGVGVSRTNHNFKKLQSNHHYPHSANTHFFSRARL